MADGTPNRTKAGFLRGDVALETDTLRMALYNDTISFTYDPATHAFVGDVLDGVVAEEFGGSGGTGYSRQTITGSVVTQDNTNDQGNWDADDVTFSSLDGETIQGAIIYKQVGGDDTTPADDEIIQVYDGDQTDINDFPIPTNGSDIVVQVDADGLLNLSAV